MICSSQDIRGSCISTTIEGTIDDNHFVKLATISEVNGPYRVRDRGRQRIRDWFTHHDCHELCRRSSIEKEVPRKEDKTEKKQPGKQDNKMNTV